MPHLSALRSSQRELAQDRGDTEVAASYYRDAIAIGERVLRPGHDYLARFREDLAGVQSARP